MHHLNEHIKNAHESGTHKCDECDNVDNGMCEIKEHMFGGRGRGIILVTMNVIKTPMSLIHISVIM